MHKNINIHKKQCCFIIIKKAAELFNSDGKYKYKDKKLLGMPQQTK
jgi:hypothetical protein